jgi:uncharacterized protein YunC (DUF1805 family)
MELSSRVIDRLLQRVEALKSERSALQRKFTNAFDWNGLQQCSVAGVNKPCLAIVGSKGFAGCAYFNTDACSAKTGDAFAKFTGVSCHDDFLDSKVIDVSTAAADLGIHVGMRGCDCLQILRGSADMPQTNNTAAAHNQAGFDWNGLQQCSVAGVNKPCLAIVGSKGFAGCAYFNTDACSAKTGDAFAKFTGVSCHDDFLDSKVIDVSTQAGKLGVAVGMSGREALALLR